MKINFENSGINIRQGLLRLKNRVFPQCYVKEIIESENNLTGLAEDTFVLKDNQYLAHGVIMEKNSSGIVNYSLVPSKQSPMKYDFVLNTRQGSKNITNLTNELEKVCYNGMEFDDLFKNNPQLSRTVGSLPQKWGRRIGNSQEKREQIDNLFTEFGREFHSKVKNKESTVKLSTDNLQKGLSEVLSADVEVSELGKGSWGQTYRLNVDSQDYVLKVYYNLSPKGYCMNKHYHGNYHELSSAVWASKNDADSYAMFYMGRFGENLDGYMLTKYVPKKKVNGKIYNGKVDLAEDNFVFSRYLHRLYCGDLDLSKENRHGKKIIDFGHTLVSKAGELDEKTFHLTKTLGRLIDENNSKELSKVVEKHKGTKEFEQAKSFLQYLINNYADEKNIGVLKSKKDLLEQVGLDYTPDIRYILSMMHFPCVNSSYETATEYRTKMYSQMLEIPRNSFEKLWYQYSGVLGIRRK